jgi:hypothetical protein
MSRSTAARKVTLPAISQKRRAAALKKTWARKRRSARMYAYRDNLPFVNRHQWWSVSPTGDYQADYDIGRQHAMEFWRQCGTYGNFGIDLGQILFAMHGPKRKRSGRHDGLSGIEVGFIRTICELFVCLVGVPAFITIIKDLPKKSLWKLNARQKRVFKKKIKMTVGFVDLLVGTSHERRRKVVVGDASLAVEIPFARLSAGRLRPPFFIERPR